MKRFLFLGLLLACLPVNGIEKGATREAVIAELGEPSGSMKNNKQEILLFKTGTVTLQSNAVTETDLSKDYVRQAEERKKQAEAFRAVQQAELEKQKKLYPEDRVTQIPCAYSKTEDWSFLPKSICPAQNNYAYDVYIPQGYHRSERYYNGLVLESPALWDGLKERARKEKWLVVILPDASGKQIGSTMNGNFLAAFDDAVKRFRMSKGHIFIAGRVPSAIFATMRPVAGIILQEPDFHGLEKADPNLNFLRQNPNLRVYALLGNRDQNNVQYQGKFIVDHIPKYRIDIYQGNVTVLPQPLADEALDWMKKEYRIPDN
jgi:hypothetical protein